MALRLPGAPSDRRRRVDREGGPRARGPHDRRAARRARRASRGAQAQALGGSDLVFTRAEGAALKRERLRAALASAAARTAAILAPNADDESDRKRAEVWLAKRDVLRFHDLRHTAASLMVAAGVPIFDVGKILGHSTIRTMLRYAHFAPAAGRFAVAALGKALAAPKPDAHRSGATSE